MMFIFALCVLCCFSFRSTLAPSTVKHPTISDSQGLGWLMLLSAGWHCSDWQSQNLRERESPFQQPMCWWSANAKSSIFRGKITCTDARLHGAQKDVSILFIFRSLTINQKSFSTATRNESVLDFVQESETQDYPLWLLQTNPTKVSVKKTPCVYSLKAFDCIPDM